MPRMRVCGEPGCPEIQAAPRCPDHTRAVERARGTRQQRGYDAVHDRLRRQWKPKVEAGQVDCHSPTCTAPMRRILPGEQWDLGHTPDRKAWRGPEHRSCNRSGGGRAAHGG
jgi:hypothetical protein